MYGATADTPRGSPRSESPATRASVDESFGAQHAMMDGLPGAVPSAPHEREAGSAGSGPGAAAEALDVAATLAGGSSGSLKLPTLSVDSEID
jgi:MFS family permease